MIDSKHLSRKMRKPTESIKKILKIMDISFGSFTVLFILIIGFHFLKTGSGLNGFLSLLGFLVFNLLLSQVSIRTKDPYPLEVFRQITGMAVLSPIILYYVQDPFSPFWYTFLIMTISSSNILYEITGKTIYGFGFTVFGTISYILSSYFLLNNPNWYLISLHCVTIMMLGVLLFNLFHLIHETFMSEVQKSQQLSETMKELKNTQDSLVYTSRMSAIGEMAGGIAHEINNPLAIISGSIFQIKKGLRDTHINPETLLNITNRISDTIERITQIIMSLKIVSRDSEVTKARDINLRDILIDATSICNERFKAHGIDFHFDPYNQIYNTMVYVDRVQLSQVFINLLSNSYDAVEGTRDAWIKIEVEDVKNFARVKVIDSGHGIAKEIVGRIFDPFFTSKDVGHGTGLGLSISKGIMEKNGGSLQLDNESQNTCFIAELPKSNPIES